MLEGKALVVLPACRESDEADLRRDLDEPVEPVEPVEPRKPGLSLD
jgi:hypothetical protein